MNIAQKKPLSSLFWMALIVTAFRIFYLFINQRNLDVEEAQYWSWSRHLALGYHSKPPMISWAIYFSTWLFGDKEWALRVLSPVTYFFTSLLVYGCGKKLFNYSVGFWSGISVLVLPAVTYSASIISTDPFLILFWSLALMAFIFANQTGRILWWVLCGAAIGLGLLSKYTMLAFFLSAILFFICNTHRPTPLKTFGPYLALLIAILIFLPNAVWNTLNHNPAFEHVIEHNIHVQGVHFHWQNLGYFLLNQMGILGPVLFIFLLIALWGWRRLEKAESALLLLCFTVPMFLLICIEALLSRAYANWAVAAYPSGVILAVAYLWELKHKALLKFSLFLNVLISIALYGFELAIAYGYCHWPIPDHPNWQDFGNKIQRQQRMDSSLSYLIDNRELWSKTLYYGKVPLNQMYVWDTHHTVDWADNITNRAIPAGKSLVFISYNAKLPGEMLNSFQSYRLLDKFPVSERLSGRRKQIYIYGLQGFKA